MEDRQEEGGELKSRRQWSGGLALPELELEIRPEPEAAAMDLPDLYGVPRLEFLIVDPEFAFVAWEVTPEQLEQARAILGDEVYAARVLQLRLLNADSHAVAGFNLYGESGRWFLRPELPGNLVVAVLGFASGGFFHELLRRGPVAFPRNEPVEASHFVEMHVEYERGAQGQLLLAGRSRKRPQPWPQSLSSAARAGWELSGDSEDAGQLSSLGGSWTIGSSRLLNLAATIEVGPAGPAGDSDD